MTSVTKPQIIEPHLDIYKPLFQDEKTWKDCSTRLWSWSAQRTEHAVSKRGRLSQGRTEATERYPQVKEKYFYNFIILLNLFFRKHVDSGECRLHGASRNQNLTSWHKQTIYKWSEMWKSTKKWLFLILDFWYLLLTFPYCFLAC